VNSNKKTEGIVYPNVVAYKTKARFSKIK